VTGPAGDTWSRSRTKALNFGILKELERFAARPEMLAAERTVYRQANLARVIRSMSIFRNLRIGLRLRAPVPD